MVDLERGMIALFVIRVVAAAAEKVDVVTAVLVPPTTEALVAATVSIARDSVVKVPRAARDMVDLVVRDLKEARAVRARVRERLVTSLGPTRIA